MVASVNLRGSEISVGDEATRNSTSMQHLRCNAAEPANRAKTPSPSLIPIPDWAKCSFSGVLTPLQTACPLDLRNRASITYLKEDTMISLIWAG